MKILFLCTLLVMSVITSSHSQMAKDLMLHMQADLIKSDNSGFFEKIQASAEANYSISQKFTATGGVEYWSDGSETSLVIGARWFPVTEAFVRVRGLIGANDVCIGGGWIKPLNEQWHFEAIGEVYTRGYITIRAGVAYVIRIK